MPCNAPLISVIMGVRYRSTDTKSLKNAIDSILAQTYRPIEFLICENGSSAESIELMRAYRESFPDIIRLIDGKGADTLAEKLNRCLDHAKGEFIARQDDDDVSEPKRLENQMEYLGLHPEVDFVGCNVTLVQSGEVVGERVFSPVPTARDFLFVQPFIHPTLVFRKDALESVGGYCEEARCDGCEDYDLLLRIYETGGQGANLQNRLFRYTIPPVGKPNRTFRMRVNEAKTRFVRFKSLGLLPRAIPYVIKPIVVGLVPDKLLSKLKQRQNSKIEVGAHE